LGNVGIRDPSVPFHSESMRTTPMSKNPRTFRQPVRLIVSVEANTVATIDKLMHSGGKHGHRNRSEFVRRAIERELQRCMADDSRGTNGA
jgi:hypothetical protein